MDILATIPASSAVPGWVALILVFAGIVTAMLSLWSSVDGGDVGEVVDRVLNGLVIMALTIGFLFCYEKSDFDKDILIATIDDGASYTEYAEKYKIKDHIDQLYFLEEIGGESK